MAPRTTLPIRKLIIRFYLRRETHHQIADMMDTNKNSGNRVSQHYKQTGSVKQNNNQDEGLKLLGEL